jgi:hypothetical protein
MRGYISVFEQPVSIFPQSDIVVIPEKFGEHGFAEPPGSEKHGNLCFAVFINLNETGFINKGIILINDGGKVRKTVRQSF